MLRSCGFDSRRVIPRPLKTHFVLVLKLQLREANMRVELMELPVG